MEKGKGRALSLTEKRIIYELSGDLGCSARPFKELGLKLGLPEEEVLETIRTLKDKGYLRRFGATLRHQLSGFTANAMVAWKVEESRVDKAGKILASFQEVTHCYHRPGVPDWPYNLYAMIHGRSEEECRALAERMSQAAGLAEYELLFSHEEHKKTSMRYFE